MKKKKFIFAFVAMVMALGVMRGLKTSQEANVEQLSAACAYAAAECASQGYVTAATVTGTISFATGCCSTSCAAAACATGIITPASIAGWLGFLMCGA
mgnify:CR=1 FL=1